MNPLRARRLELGLSQSQVAAASGLSRQLVSAVEGGRNTPSVAAALALAGVLEAEVEDLFGPPPVADWEPVVGDASEAGVPVLAARVGERGVYLPLPHTGASPEGWRRADGVTGENGVSFFEDRSPEGLVVAGCDPLLRLAAELLPAAGSRRLLPVPATSVEAVRALHRDRAHAAIVHGTGERLAAPTPRARAHRIARWQVGIAASDRALLDLADIAAGRISIAHRPVGAEAEKALGRALTPHGGPGGLKGTVASGHIEAAGLAAAASVDVALTMEPAANAFGLTFIPLEEHLVELRVDERWEDHPGVGALGELLGSTTLAARLAVIGGYDLLAR